LAPAINNTETSVLFNEFNDFSGGKWVIGRASFGVGTNNLCIGYNLIG
jgi:hypothetical protein